MSVILAAESIPHQYHQTLFDQGCQIMTLDEVNDQNIESIEIMFGWNKVVGPKILAAPNSQLKWIQTATSGVDYMPLETLKEKQILVSNARGMHATPIAQTCLSYLFYFTRGLHQSCLPHQQHQWQHHQVGQSMVTLKHKKLLVYGTGQIGTKVAKYLRPFGIETIGVNRRGDDANYFDRVYATPDASSVISEADFIVNVMPLTHETQDFFNAEFFNKMSKNAYFFNLGRGQSVDEAALIQALEQDVIAGAAIDVAKNEPLSETSPLWEVKNLLITPHVSGYIPDLHERVYQFFAQNLPGYLNNKTLIYNVVDLTEGY